MFAVMGIARTASAADKKAREKVVLQVSDDSPKTWNQALNVVENLQQAYGKENVDIKLIAFGFGLGILKLDSVTEIIALQKQGRSVIRPRKELSHRSGFAVQ